MTKQADSYREILKGTSVMGGTQLFLALLNIIRGKIVAVLLGPEGMGVANLFNTSSQSIQRFASLGLNLAMVREISSQEPSLSSDDAKTGNAHVIAVCTRLVSITAIIGALFCVIFSRWLSNLTFGTGGYEWQFILLGGVVFFQIGANGKISILQGLHDLKALAASSLWGAVTSLCASVPLYYFFRTGGIVPAMLVFATVTYIVYSWYLHRRHRGLNVRTHLSDNKQLIKKLVVLGVVLMGGEMIASLCTYLLSVYIRQASDTSTLGIYQAATSITTQGLALVFAAMAADYFPRLSAIIADNAKMTETVNRQSVVISLLVTPMAMLIMAFAPLIVKLLLSSEFSGATPLLRILALGIMLKAFSFPMAYISFAKGNKRLYFTLEGVVCNLLTLTLGIGGFHLFGLAGAAYAVVADNLLCIFIYLAVNAKIYGYRMTREVISRFTLCAAAASLTFAAFQYTDALLAFVAASILTASTTIYSGFTIRKLFFQNKIS